MAQRKESGLQRTEPAPITSLSSMLLGKSLGSQVFSMEDFENIVRQTAAFISKSLPELASLSKLESEKIMKLLAGVALLLVPFLVNRERLRLWPKMLARASSQMVRVIATAQQLRYLRSNLGVKMPYSRSYLMSTLASVSAIAATLPSKRKSPLHFIVFCLLLLEIILLAYSLYLISVYNRGLSGPSPSRPSLTSAGRKMNVPAYVGWWLVALLTGHVSVSSLRNKDFQKSEIALMLSMLPAFLSNMQLGHTAARTSGSSMRPTSSISMLGLSYLLFAISALFSTNLPISRLIIASCMASVLSLALNLWMESDADRHLVPFPTAPRAMKNMSPKL